VAPLRRLVGIRRHRKLRGAGVGDFAVVNRFASHLVRVNRHKGKRRAKRNVRVPSRQFNTRKVREETGLSDIAKLLAEALL
jgi:hypothetical protein